MSDQQKFFACISGAVIVHVVLLMLVFLLVSIENSGAFSTYEVAPQPEEVTIRLSNLLDQVELEEPEPVERAREYFDTDSNAPEEAAPENARFESDRNTSAASELAPDPNLPQEALPTTRGDSPLEHFHLQDRDHTDGEFDQPPASEGANGYKNSPDGANQSFENEKSLAEAMSSQSDSLGESDSTVEGVDTPPKFETGEEKQRSKEQMTDGESETATSQRSYHDSTSNTVASMLGDVGETDQQAANQLKPEEEVKIGNSTDLEREQLTRADDEGLDSNHQDEAQPSSSKESTINPADKGLFAEGFSSEEIQNFTNGERADIGQNAVDAEKTAVGMYKAKVKRLIAQSWHRYRELEGGHVTIGVLKMKFRTDRHGKVHDATVVKNESDSVLAEFSLKAILDADLPPMPKEVLDEVGQVGLWHDYNFIIY